MFRGDAPALWIKLQRVIPDLGIAVQAEDGNAHVGAGRHKVTSDHRVLGQNLRARRAAM